MRGHKFTYSLFFLFSIISFQFSFAQQKFNYDKEWQKGIMPNKFKDLMDPKEMLALATWLGTFKNTAVNTPKPIKKN